MLKHRIPLILRNKKSHYYPFGMIQPGRSFNSNSYRYGFQNQEKDDEITGVTGSHLSYDFRIYDSRIGRWLSVDPLAMKYSNMSPYNFCANNPIMNVDYDGRDIWVFVHKTSKEYSGHAMIGVTEYDKDGNKTGNIIIYELYPQKGERIVGNNPVKGIVETHSVSMDDIASFATKNQAEYLQLATGQEVDNTATNLLNTIDEKMESGKLKYKAGNFNCSTLAIIPIKSTETDEQTNLGEESGRVLGIKPFSVHSPNELWNDLLGNKNLVKTSNNNKPLETGMVKKYLTGHVLRALSRKIQSSSGSNDGNVNTNTNGQ